MKPVLSLTLSFFLFAFITNLSPSNAVQPVFDKHGNPLNPRSQYYILPASDNPSSGGLTLDKVGDSECPLTVLQNNAITGLPVKFTILGNITSNIVTGTDLEIEFTEKPDCAESSKWLMFVDHNTQLSCVGIGGPGNYPGVEINGGKFLILKHGSGYRVGFCLDTTGDCAYVGLQKFNSGEGGSRLILTVTDAYSVVFVDAASINTMSNEGNANSALPI